MPEPPADTPTPVPAPAEVARIQVDDRIPVTMALDLDRDGLDEVIIADVLGGEYPHTEAGVVRVLAGPIASGSWSELPARLVLRGEQPFRHFGTAMTAGDLDGDGILDVVLRADPSAEGIGTICAISGALTGEQTIQSAAFLTVAGPSTLGQALMCLDYNGDGRADLLVSCPVRSEVYVVLGPRTGQVELPRDADAVLFTESGSLGWSVAVGDFNRDGTVDLALCEPISDSVFLVPGGLTGRHAAGDVAWAVLHTSAPTDDLAGVGTLASANGNGPALIVRSRRTDSEQAGTMFVVNSPISGNLDLRRDSYMSLEYVAPVLGVSADRVPAGPAGAALLALGTPGRSQIPDSNLKGGVFLLSPDLQGDVNLEPSELGSQCWYLRPQDVGLDWLGRDVLAARVIDAATQNLLVSGKGAVIVFAWP